MISLFHWKGGKEMLFEYIQGALESAEYKKLDDGTWFAEISGFEGVWTYKKIGTAPI